MSRELAHSTEEATLAGRSASRLFELDALRGIAAFTVIWHHLKAAIPGDPFHGKRLYPLFAGHEAVILFFVLSGYVLSIPFREGRPLRYVPYLVRRVFRIYVPYLAALIIAWIAASHFLYTKLPLSTWYYSVWQSPLTARRFINHAFLITDGSINTAFWSLRYEMEMSILFPWVCRALQKLSLLMSVVLIMLLTIAAMTLDIYHLTYAICFLVGAQLSLYSKGIEHHYRKISMAGKLLLAFLVFRLFYARIPGHYSESVTDVFTLLGSAGLIIFSLNANSFRRLLRHSIFEYLGRVSYSLYLLHGTVLFVLLDTLYTRIPLSALTVVFIIACWSVSHVFCVLVEEPSTFFGKRVAKVLSDS